MNLLPGVVRKGAAGSIVDVDGAALPAPDRPGLNEGRKVVFGIRPEHLSLTESGGFPAQVVVIEPTGSETHVVLRLGGREITAVFRERHAFTPGAGGAPSAAARPDPHLRRRQRGTPAMTRTLLCFGDSNTHGTMPMPTLDALGRFDRDTRWTGQLQKLLPDWHVIEEGQPGRTTLHDDPVEGAHRNGLTVLPAILESHREIDAVILMLGTNDLKGRFSLNATDIALSLEKLVLTIRASARRAEADRRRKCCSWPRRRSSKSVRLGEIFGGGAVKSQDLGARIAVSAKRVGTPFLDAGELIKVSHVDGIHYDAAEQGILAARLRRSRPHPFRLTGGHDAKGHRQPPERRGAAHAARHGSRRHAGAGRHQLSLRQHRAPDHHRQRCCGWTT